MIALRSYWWLLAITSYFSVLSTIDKRDFIITPSENVTCPTQPCFVLNDIASVVNEQLILDNATFSFFPGIHHLDIELRIENASFVKFLVANEAQDSNVEVHVSLLGYIWFVDCDNIDISGLTFVLTEGLTVSKSVQPRSTLNFQTTAASLSNLILFGNGTFRQSSTIMIHSSQTKVSNMTVLGTMGSIGAALLAYRSTVNFYGQNFFVNNNVVIRVPQGNLALGGVMLLWECIVNFFGMILFLDNAAISDHYAQGGAICSDNSTLIFSGSALFQRNNALAFQGEGSGGAIAVYSNSVLTFGAMSNMSFVNNGAVSGGGAIILDSSDSELKIQGTALFEANRAQRGGAIMGNNSWIYCSGRNIKFRNNTGYVHGGAMYITSSRVLLEKVLFEDNRAGSLTGGALTVRGSHLHISSSAFINNSAFLNAGAVYISTSAAVVFNGTNHFERNHAPNTAAVDVFDANVVFSGDNNFLRNNSTLECGSLGLVYSTVLVSGRSTFYNNHGVYGGAIKAAVSNLTISGNSFFMSNTAFLHGGAIMSFYGNVSITGQVSFVNNRARACATALHALNSDLTLDGNISISGGRGFTEAFTEGAIYLLNTTGLFTGVLSLTNNSGFNGGGIFLKASKVDFEGCIQYIDNQAVSSGGGLHVLNSKIILRGNCSKFQSNTAQEGGAIYSKNSSVYMTGTLTFMRNSATRGGALALYSNSILTLTEPFQADFVGNQANIHGGAVYFEDRSYSNIIQCIEPIYRGECPIELNSTTDIQLNFFYNTAGSAGTVLYGGGFDTCRLYLGGGTINSCGNRIGGHYREENPLDIIQNISNIVNDDSKTSKISSEPLHVCFCETFGMECNLTKK